MRTIITSIKEKKENNNAPVFAGISLAPVPGVVGFAGGAVVVVRARGGTRSSVERAALMRKIFKRDQIRVK